MQDTSRSLRGGPVGLSPRGAMSGAAQANSETLALPVKIFILTLLIPVGFQVGPLFMNGQRVFLLAMIIPLFFKLISGGMGRIILTDILFILHVFWMAVALGVNSPASVVEQVGSVGMEFLGGYLVGRNYIRNRAQFLALCKFLIWSVILMIPLTLAESQTGTPYIIEAIKSVPGLRSFSSVYADPRLGLHRVQNVFTHPIHFGLYCSITIPLAYIAMRDSISDNRRLVFAGLMFASAFMGLSAGVMLAMVAQVGLITWYALFRNFKAKWWLLIGLLVFLYVLVDILSTRTPIRVFMTYATFSPHTAYWRGIIFDWGWMNIFGSDRHNIPASPLVGIGLRDWVRPPYMYSGSMDNFWLLNGVRYGVPGFLTLAIGYLYVMWKVGRRSDFDHDDQLLNIRRAWMFVFVGLTLTLSTVHIWGPIYAFVIFFFGSGVWLMTAEPEGTDDPDPDATDEDDGTPTPVHRPYSRFPVQPTPVMRTASGP